MISDKQLLEQALEALLRSKKAVSEDLDLASCAYGSVDPDGHRYADAKKALSTLKDAITAIRARLKQPEERYTYGTPLLDAFTKPAPVQELVSCPECNGKGEMETGIGMMVCDVCHGSGVKDSLTAKQPAAPVQEPVAQGVRFHERLAQNKTALEKMAAKNRHVAYVCPQCMWTLEEKEEGDWGEHPDRLMGRIDGVSAPMQPEQEPEYCDPSATIYKLAEMVMSDCGHSTNNQRLLDRIADRIQRHIDATTPPAAQRQWFGLTEEERNHARHTVTYSQLAMTAGEWTEAVQIETEKRLKEKNT